MGRQPTWLSDAEWARIEPLLPRARRGARRVDDRRVISGIVHMLRSGTRWRDCPPEYGPYTTVYNRYNRWSQQGIWLRLVEALAGHDHRGSPTAAAPHKTRRRPPAQEGRPPASH